MTDRQIEAIKKAIEQRYKPGDILSEDEILEAMREAGKEPHDQRQ